MEHHDHSRSKEIWVNEFTEKSAQKFRERVLQISEEDANAVIPIYIDSYGGYVDSLAKMIETMDEVPNRFLTIAMGKAVSCGAILLSHGDIRYCGRYSRIMIHNVSSMSWGDIYSMKAGTDEAVRLNERFMGLLAEHCDMTYDQLQRAIKATTDSKEIWLDAEAAKKFGIIDFVGTPVLRSATLWQVDTNPEKERLVDDLKNKNKKKPRKKTTSRKKATTKRKSSK